MIDVKYRWYDDVCDQCSKEQTVSIHYVQQETWQCYVCEYDNPLKNEGEM